MDTDTNETPKHPNRLADARIRTGATQQEAADAADLTITGYQNYEYGKRDIEGDALRKLAQFFGCSANCLLGVGDDCRKPKPSSTYRPLAGRMAAGTPLEAIEMDGEQQRVGPPVLDGRPGGFFLTASGDSMSLRYPDGRMVYIDKNDRETENGKCCAVLVNGDDATLKQVFKAGGTIALHPMGSTPSTRTGPSTRPTWIPPSSRWSAAHAGTSAAWSSRTPPLIARPPYQPLLKSFFAG